MKIALLTDGIYPFVLGGMQKHSFYLAKYLAKMGMQVDLYHCVPFGIALPDSLFGFSSKELQNVNSLCFHFPKNHSFPGHYLYESKIYSNKLFELFQKQEKVDFIYAQGFTGWSFVEKKKNKFSLPPIGVNFHGVEMFQKAPNFHLKLQHYLLREPVKYILRNADLIFSLGGKLTTIQNKLTNQKIVEIPIGIEDDWLLKTGGTSRKEVRTFVFTGRYERRKGIEELQEVVAQLSVDYEFEIIFIGPIPDNKKLKRNNVHYLGYIREEAEIKKVLKHADILICPSYSEGMPTVILEAMASGMAVIATDVGAVSKLVNEDTGWLIPSANFSALKDAVLKAIKLDGHLLQRKKEASLNLIEKEYIWKRVIETTISEISLSLNE